MSHHATGKAVTLPNSIFLTAPVINESFTQDYMLHSFSVPVKMGDNWQQAEQALLAAAEEACRPFIDRAKQHLQQLATREGLETPTIEPRVTVSVPDPGTVNLVVRIPVPAQQKNRLHQQILRRYLETAGISP